MVHACWGNKTVLWCLPVALGCGWWQQKDQKFKASLHLYSKFEDSLGLKRFPLSRKTNTETTTTKSKPNKKKTKYLHVELTPFKEQSFLGFTVPYPTRSLNWKSIGKQVFTLMWFDCFLPSSCWNLTTTATIVTGGSFNSYMPQGPQIQEWIKATVLSMG